MTLKLVSSSELKEAVMIGVKTGRRAGRRRRGKQQGASQEFGRVSLRIKKAQARDLPRAEIDVYSGWDIYKHSRDMQLHYAGQDRQHRIKRCDITRWI